MAGSARSAAVVVPRIMELFPQLKSVVDVGCGTGVWLHHFQLCGVDHVVGIDGGEPSSLLQIDPNNFISADLRQPFPVSTSYDLAICLEVAEHLPADSAQSFISELCKLSDKIVFSAAIPGQGGTGHLNERWPGYWAALFSDNGYDCFDVIRPLIWFDERVEWWYAQNILVFAKRNSDTKLDGIKRGKILDMTHPRCFRQFRRSDEVEESHSFLDKMRNAGERVFGANLVPANDTRYLASAPIDLNTKYLFVEFPILHEFLFDAYGELAATQFLPAPAAGWWIAADGYNYILRSLNAGIEKIFFLTLERLLYDPDVTKFIKFATEVRRPISGILHRLPEDKAHLKALKEAVAYVDSIVVLSNEMIDEARRLVGNDARIEYLPHHAPNEIYYRRQEDVRSKIGAKKDDIVVSLIGELRSGKGAGLLLEALEHLSKEGKERLFFLFAGKEAEWNRAQIEKTLGQCGCRGFVDIRPPVDANDFRVMSNQELVDYMCTSDIGLLLYQQAQRRCASGVLPGYVWARKRILATKNSVVGREVARYGLGDVLEDEMPASLGYQLSRYASSGEVWSPSAHYEEFRESISSKAVTSRLIEILRRRD